MELEFHAPSAAHKLLVVRSSYIEVAAPSCSGR